MSATVDPAAMHRFDADSEQLAQALVEYATQRLGQDPPPLDRPHTADELSAAVGDTVTAAGLGWEQALRIYREQLEPAMVSIDHPRYLAFIPSAPTAAASLFDLVVSASAVYAGNWLEGAGAVHAENQALRWLCDLAGLPEGAGGCFVSGGTAGNLSALVAARHDFRERTPGSGRLALAATVDAHSSIRIATRVMDVDLLAVEGDERGRLTGPALERALADQPADRVFAVAATAGTTNAGHRGRPGRDRRGVPTARAVDARGRRLRGGGPGRAVGPAAVRRHRTRGQPDHRPAQVAVLALRLLRARVPLAAAGPGRPPAVGRLPRPGADRRRVEPLRPRHPPVPAGPRPALLVLAGDARHGAYARAIEGTLEVARAGARGDPPPPELELLIEPELSVLVFRRVGWEAADYHAWSQRLLREGTAFVMPTTFRGEIVTRFAVVNPRTSLTDLTAVLDTMA